MSLNEREADIAERVLVMFREEQLSPNEGWLILITLAMSCAAGVGMTWKETQTRAAKAFALYKRGYDGRKAGTS